MEGYIRRTYLLYAVGVLFGVIAVFYFAFILLEDLSPTSTAMLLFFGFVFFGAAGLATEVPRLDVVAYLLGSSMYLIGIWYTISRFDISDIGIVAILGISSALFITLGYLSIEGYLEPDRRSVGVVMVVVFLLASGMVVADAIGPQPTTETSIEPSMSIPDEGEGVAIGTVTVENDFFLSRTADPPSVYACLYTPQEEIVPITIVDWRSGMVLSGGESATFDLVIRWQAFYDLETEERHEPFQDRETIPIETASECPEHADSGTLIVVEGERPLPPIR